MTIITFKGILVTRIFFILDSYCFVADIPRPYKYLLEIVTPPRTSNNLAQSQRVPEVDWVIGTENILIYSASATTRRYAVPDSHPQVSGRGKPSTTPHPIQRTVLHGASISDPTDRGKSTRRRRQLKGKSSSLSAVRQAHGRWCFRVSGLVALLFPGVAFLVGFLQVLNGQFRVGFEHVQGFMSEQFLDVVHVGAAPDEFGCAGSPERVR